MEVVAPGEKVKGSWVHKDLMISESLSSGSLSGPCQVGLCYHVTARPQAVDRETDCIVEGRCEYIE